MITALLIFVGIWYGSGLIAAAINLRDRYDYVGFVDVADTVAAFVYAVGGPIVLLREIGYTKIWQRILNFRLVQRKSE